MSPFLLVTLCLGDFIKFPEMSGFCCTGPPALFQCTYLTRCWACVMTLKTQNTQIKTGNLLWLPLCIVANWGFHMLSTPMGLWGMISVAVGYHADLTHLCGSANKRYKRSEDLWVLLVTEVMLLEGYNNCLCSLSDIKKNTQPIFFFLFNFELW